MTSPYVTGAVPIYVAPPGVSTPQFFGWAKKSVRIRIMREWEQLWASDGGTKIPADLAYQGTHAFVILTMTKWSELLLAYLQNLRGALSGGRGVDLLGDLGALMILEQFACRLYLQFPYASKATMQAALMPVGYRFRAAVLLGPDELNELGTAPQENQLVFHCLRIKEPLTQSWICFDHNLTDVAGVVVD